MTKEKLYPLAHTQALLHTGEIAAANSLLVRESDIMGFSLTAKEQDYTPEEIADALEKALNHFVRNNDTLRLRFCRVGLSWQQYVTPFENTTLERKKYPDGDSFAAYMNKTYLGRPNWKKEILWLAEICLLPDHSAILAVRVSHYAFDGYSFSLAYRRIHDAYKAYLRGEQPAEKPAPSYLAYVEALEAYKKSEQHKADARYWLKAFLGLKNYSFPAGHPAVRLENDVVKRHISPELREKIAAAAALAECSVPFYYESAVALTVYQLTHKVCFNISTLSHGRIKYSEKQTVGNMANSFGMFFRIEEGNLNDWVHRAYLQYLENVGHCRFPASEIIPFTWKEAFLHGMNFMVSWFLFSSMDFGQAQTDADFRLSTLPRVAQSYQLYGALLDVPTGEVELALNYQSHKYTREKADKLIDTYVDVLTRMASSPNANIREIIR